ncbi:MAG TPA: hypothetical protein VFY99_02970 [Solirubrobacterales bacterium]
MDDLRQRLARGDYSVDPQRVAGSLVTKMKLIQIARRSIGLPPTRQRREQG